MRIVETKVYPFAELTDSAKEKAFETFQSINVDYEWWESTYEDAKQVGIKITEFDIGRRSFCGGNFCKTAEDVAKRILQEHGKDCETYKTAHAFLVAMASLDATEDEQFEDLEIDFRVDILEDYRILLRRDYEYLTSKDAIIETIEANEYEFTANGKLWG